MAIEKFSTLKPAPGQGKRILKSKLLTALGATGVLAPFPQNPEHILERKILLQTPFLNGASGGGGGIGPCTAGLTFASAWAAQVVANGGAAPTTAEQNAVATFQCSLITAGLDSQMIVWNPFAASSLIAARTPPLKGSGAALWTNNAFVNADLTTAGLTGNGSTKYLQTGGDPIGASATGQNVCTFAYVTAVSTAASARSWMTFNGSIILGISAKDNTTNSLGASGGNPSNVITTPSQGNGLYLDSRVNSADHRLFFANGATAFAQIGATDVNINNNALPGTEFYAFALNNNGSPFGFSTETIGMVGAAKGMTLSQGQTLATAIQTLMTAFGRNV